MRRYPFYFALLILLGVCGCGNPMTTIKGTVTLDGQPLERGRIEFAPSDGKGPLAAAEIRDGAYEVLLLTGTKTVRITGGKVIGQRPFTTHPSSPMIEDIKPLVPACYNENTTLVREIASGQTVCDFELRSDAAD